MLILERKKGEEILIGNDVLVKVTELRTGHVRLGVVAPRSVRVVRREMRHTDANDNGATSLTHSKDFAWSSVDPNIPPQRFEWIVNGLRPKFGLLEWLPAFEQVNVYFSGHHEPLIVPHYAMRSPQAVAEFVNEYLQGINRGFRTFGFRMIDTELFSLRNH